MAKRICDVHYWYNGDKNEREVFWCKDCRAYICHECKDKIFRRFLAMCNRWLHGKVK